MSDVDEVEALMSLKDPPAKKPAGKRPIIKDASPDTPPPRSKRGRAASPSPLPPSKKPHPLSRNYISRSESEESKKPNKKKAVVQTKKKAVPAPKKKEDEQEVATKNK